jgi:aspartate/methionine/tyrosine aminotransferase
MKDNFPWKKLRPNFDKTIKFSKKVLNVLKEHQILGHFFHYRETLPILGVDYKKVFENGRLGLNPDKYADFAPLHLLMYPAPSVIQYLKRTISKKELANYSPDLLNQLRDEAAKKIFFRRRNSEFEVIGTEGAQAGVAYTILSFINPKDEVVVTDPGYFFFIPTIKFAGGKPVKIILNRKNGFKVSFERLKEKITSRTKMIIICDPINPFGTVYEKKDLIKIAKLANKKNIMILNDITHNTYRIEPKVRQYPLSSLYKECPTKNVIATAGLSSGYGLAGLRLGFLAGHPDLISALILTKSIITRINTNILGQFAALQALRDVKYRKKIEQNLRKNYKLLEEIISSINGISVLVKPKYCYSACVDITRTGTSAQELTIALFKRRCAVYPPDGLGDTMMTDYLRVNFSTPYQKHFEWLKKALPEAIKEAKSGMHRSAVIEFFKKNNTSRGRKIIRKIMEISKG